MKSLSHPASRRRFLRASTLAVASAPAVVRGAAARAEFNLAFATVAPRGSSFHQTLQDMIQQWKEASGGRVGVTVYPGTQGGEPAIVRRMGINQLQGAMLTAGGMAQIDRSPTALQLMPMVFDDWSEVDHVRDVMRPRLEEALNRKGYEVLFWGDAGWVRWFTKKPVLRPADVRTMKIFADAGDPIGLEIVREYYQPVPLEPDKIFTALSTGLIEGVTLPAFLANFTQIATVTGHMLDLKYAPLTGAMVVSTRAWSRIPEDLRGKLRAIADATGALARKNSRAEDDAAIEVMRSKQGLKVAETTPEIVAEWRRAISAAYPAIRGPVVPAPLFDEVLALVKAFRAKADA
ncbi:MAG: TRAP transporter substrate-binding protein DctP [Limisphaerales bacterium]